MFATRKLLTSTFAYGIFGLTAVGMTPPVRAAADKNDTNEHADKHKSSLVSSNCIIGESLYSKAEGGDEVASVTDIVMNKDGQIAYLITKANATLGFGGKQIAVPIAAVDCKCVKQDGEKSCRMVINKTAEQLDSAPEVTLDGYGDLTVDSFVQRNDRFFGVKSEATFNDTGAILNANALVNKSVYCDAGNECGVLDAIIVDTESGKAQFAIVGSGGTLGVNKSYTALPYDALNCRTPEDSNQRKLMVDASAMELGAAPKVTPSDYPELDHDDFRNDVRQALGQTQTSAK